MVWYGEGEKIVDRKVVADEDRRKRNLVKLVGIIKDHGGGEGRDYNGVRIGYHDSRRC